MNTAPEVLWTTLPPTLRRQIVDDITAVLAESFVMSELIESTHLVKRTAVVDIRQKSTPHQVVNNQESLRLQYALRQRAHELRWH